MLPSLLCFMCLLWLKNFFAAGVDKERLNLYYAYALSREYEQWELSET
jgi:hypothetical protein